MSKKIALFLPSNTKSAGGIKGILSNEETKRLRTTLSKKFNVQMLEISDLHNIFIKNNDFSCNSIDLGKVDLFYWHALGMEKYQTELEALSQKITVLKSPTSFRTVADKFLSHSALRVHGLPVADFALLNYNDLVEMQNIIKKWHTVLIKPRLGNFGRGIIKVSDFETLRDIAGYLKMEHGQNNIFIERFYDNDASKWISTTVIGEKVAYGYRKKRSKFAGWKVYDIKAKGGDAYYADPSPVKQFAEKAAGILDRSIVGFDFIKTKDGYKIVDENNFPGFYPEAFRVARKDPAEMIAEMIAESI